jgi:replication initiation protein RepC
MTVIQPVTPFGAALNSLVFKAEYRHRKNQTQIRAEVGQGAPSNDSSLIADKWALLRALTTAREAYGLSDRAIVVLDALLSCNPGRALDGTVPQIVHPSNRELQARTGGMAQATLRRHISSLVSAGLIMRRDSPNGKRYTIRDDYGAKADAFGFDLSPFAAAAGNINEAAEAIERATRALKRLREQVSLHLRDCAKIAAAGLTQAETAIRNVAKHQAAFEAMTEELAAFSPRLPRGRDGVALEAMREGLAELFARLETAYLSLLDDCPETQDSYANDANFERHQQNSNTDTSFDNGLEKELKQSPVIWNEQIGVETKTVVSEVHQEEPGTKQHEQLAAVLAGGAGGRTEIVSLTRVIAACPDFAAYARDGIRDWAEAALTANLVRSMLGVSPDAWRQAISALGRDSATTAIACILQRAEHIRSPGGYLRTLADKAETAGFNIEPMLRAVEGRK